MESSGTIPPVGVPAEDLRALLEGPGPFATAYLSTDPAVERATARTELHWDALRAQLLDAGAPDEAVVAMDGHVADAHTQGPGLAVVADAGGVRLVEHLDEAPEAERATWSAVPDVVPLLRSRQRRIAHVVVLADRGGADVNLVEPGGSARDLEVGDGEPERKVAAGGWSQRRFQQRAEDDWAHTAREVAREVAAVAGQVEARLVVLGGDLRAVQLILDDLPDELVEQVRLIEPGRAADGSEQARDDEVRRLVATAVAEDTVALLEAFREELGQRDRAVEGAADTIAALERSAVGLLLVHDDTERHAFVGASPLPVHLDDPDGADGGPWHRVRLADALVRAALATGAGVRVTPEHGPAAEGIGAVLRWRPEG